MDLRSNSATKTLLGAGSGKKIGEHNTQVGKSPPGGDSLLVSDGGGVRHFLGLENVV